MDLYCLICRSYRSCVGTSAIYGADHDLRSEILGVCKAPDTPLGSLSYHSVEQCRCKSERVPDDLQDRHVPGAGTFFRIHGALPPAGALLSLSSTKDNVSISRLVRRVRR